MTLSSETKTKQEQKMNYTVLILAVSSKPDAANSVLPYESAMAIVNERLNSGYKLLSVDFVRTVSLPNGLMAYEFAWHFLKG